jgi:ADP-heptose:LPS heptosyltransferase
LLKELEKNSANVRAHFYLANSYKEQGLDEKAIEMYRKYLTFNGWQDERFMAQKYMGQIRLKEKRYVEAIKEFIDALVTDDRWAEAYYYIGECFYYLGKHELCISWMQMALAKPLPDSPMFKETRIYEDLPHRYISSCHENLGDADKALEACRKALEKRPFDFWLLERLEHLKKKSRMVIECYRQGALGDCLMTTASLRGLKEKYPGCFIRYVTHPLSFKILENNKYIDELTTQGGDADLKFYFCYPDKNSTLGDEGYPDKPLSRHLVKIFNECAGLPNDSLDLECTLTEKEEAFGRGLARDIGKYVTLQAQAGWSEYKEWYDSRWEEIILNLKKSGYEVLQLGNGSSPLLKGVKDFRDIGLKSMASVIKHACLHMGVDSIGNHLSKAMKTRAVILFGSTSPVGSGYAENINIWKGLDCSPCYRERHWSPGYKGECPHAKKCMDEISIEEIWKVLTYVLN